MRTRRQQISATGIRQRGFTLVEAMVALVVLSVGMIGIAALFAQGLGAGRTAQYRTQAVNLIADMADQIRANRPGQAAYAGPTADNNCVPVDGTVGGGVVDCPPALMAAHDLFLWEQQVEQTLPDGEIEILFDATTLPPSFTIDVGWVEVGVGTIHHQMQIRVPPI